MSRGSVRTRPDLRSNLKRLAFLIHLRRSADTLPKEKYVNCIASGNQKHIPVTDPRNFELIGVPPKDLLEAVATAWQQAGLDVVECLRLCTLVTGEFQYTESEPEIRDRIKPKRIDAKTIPVKNKTLAEILDPQPRCSAVLFNCAGQTL